MTTWMKLIILQGNMKIDLDKKRKAEQISNCGVN